MLTPQEVAQRSFGKASFGGYSMAMVDDFLDEVTADYEALFNENALLKQKLGVLSGKIREYQSTEEGMRKALMTAQQTADELVKETEAKCAKMLAEAEERSASMQSDIARDLGAEAQKLQAAQSSVSEFKERIRAICQQEMDYLDQLDQLVQPVVEQVPAVDSAVEDIQAAVERSVAREDEDLQSQEPTQEIPQAQEEAEPIADGDAAPQPHVSIPEVEESSVALYEKLMADRKAAQSAEEPDPTAPTRRVERRTLEFGKDFEID